MTMATRTVQCPICQEDIKDPRLLPCTHSFCLERFRSSSLLLWSKSSLSDITQAASDVRDRSKELCRLGSFPVIITLPATRLLL